MLVHVPLPGAPEPWFGFHPLCHWNLHRTLECTVTVRRYRCAQVLSVGLGWISYRWFDPDIGWRCAVVKYFRAAGVLPHAERSLVRNRQFIACWSW